MSNALVWISFEHHEAHAGDSFTCNAVDLVMALNDTLILAFKTPAGTKRTHVVMSFSTLVGGDLQMLEGPTWNNQTGSKHPIYNRKREAVMNSSTLLEDQAQVGFVASDNLILNPVNLAGGTDIHNIWAFGKKDKLSAGSMRDLEELILKPDTQYAMIFTSNGANNKAQVILNWYEHTDSN